MRPERLVALSDGVFAIAMTLMVLQLEVPNLPPEQGSELPRHVLALWPHFLAYVLSFLVVGTLWGAHHRVFSHVGACDGTTLWLNLLFLLCVSFLPFPTGLVGKYSEQRFAVIFYAVAMSITSLMLTCLLWHVSRSPGLLRHDRDPRWVRGFCLRKLSVPLVFLVSIPISFLSETAAMVSWAAIPATERLMNRFVRMPDEPA